MTLQRTALLLVEHDTRHFGREELLQPRQLFDFNALAVDRGFEAPVVFSQHPGLLPELF